MAIIDNTSDISERLHQIKHERAQAASGAELDRIGADYSVGRQHLELDDDYRRRVLWAISKVINDAQTAQIRRTYENIRFVHLTVRREARAGTG